MPLREFEGHKAYSAGPNDFVYIKPTIDLLNIENLNISKGVRGIVIESGYQSPSEIDAKNQFSSRF